MRQSQLFTKTSKEFPKDEESINAKLLTRGGFVDKLASGVYSFLPLGFRVLKKIENIIRREMNALGGQELLLPALHPKSNWETTRRWYTLDILYKVQDNSGREFALGSTHEEVIVPLAQQYIYSYKDIPFSAYQIQTKFRMELRAKSGLLRGREFIMKDLYSFHIKKESLDEFYEKAKKAYEKIFEEMGLSKKTFLTLASGGSFSKYSHEFQTLTEAGEDIIHICNNCNLAINREIKNEYSKCPECQGKEFKKEKSIEIANIFKLQDKYSKPFNLKIKDENGENQPVIMGCYGIGLNRLMGTIVEIYHDEKGIVWPEKVAPFRIHLISLNKNKEAEIIYENFKKNKIEVLFDDRDISAGEKFADSDLIGLPCRVVLSAKSLEKGGMELKKRNEKEGQIIASNKLIDVLKTKN